MSTEADEFFGGPLPVHDAELGPEADLVQRDRWKRPVIDGVSHTRASTLANMLSDHSGIHTWEKRLLVLGMGRDFRLVERASALPDIYDTAQDKRLLTPEQRDSDAQTKYALDDIGKEAMDRAGRMTKAWYGTAFHAHTDPDNSGNKQVPATMKADVDAYWHEVVAVEQLVSEKFMVNPELTVAGTPDGFYRVPGLGVVVGDKKTGIFEPTEWVVQMATYARARFFVPHEGAEDPIDAWEDYNWNVGIVFHAPRHAAKTTMYVVNLEIGWRGAQLAAMVRDWRRDVKNKDVVTILTREETLAPTYEMLFATIAGVKSRDDLRALWTEHANIWTDELTAAGTSRLDEIAASE